LLDENKEYYKKYQDVFLNLRNTCSKTLDSLAPTGELTAQLIKQRKFFLSGKRERAY
jgi:hypothetical protein